ncbi:Gfo/Idh/MocA family oxidoreductase [Achromobacter spanius]|uniref:Gfo/Idh/MocA family oxidoreductase n=1 Tax=Achromobacter spanius TaxID=217203 RepID=UPI002225EE37|nr:Gfo/Idh/MocA family oxidoreductase [Achromobacter spanius]MCW3151051.1 Gfo/Idh/MocA family oxidoreductase [Achromobacter spanius]
MNESVLLIGAGNLGSRHLQSLADAPWINRVVVVEPSQVAADVARTRWQDVPNSHGKSLAFITLDNALRHGPFDSAVIATPAPGRLDVLGAVLGLGIKRILCEKVLFQSEAELDEALEMVIEAGADVRVNHIYRYLDALVQLSKVTVGQTLSMSVDIDGDGMGCNLIHYVDLFAYLSGADVTALSAEIDLPVHESKRGGKFVEFTGNAVATDENGGQLRVTYHDKSPASAPRICVEGAFGRAIFDEATGSVVCDITALRDLSFSVPRVSALTASILMAQLDGRCLLPTLAQSAQMNRLMLRTFNQQLAGRHERDLACPIT